MTLGGGEVGFSGAKAGEEVSWGGSTTAPLPALRFPIGGGEDIPMDSFIGIEDGQR
jgi:hypothetical protein